MRKYIKDELDFEPVSKVTSDKELGVIDHKEIQIELPSDLTTKYLKGDEFASPKSFIIIVSGGQSREPDYFSIIERNSEIFDRIKLSIITEDSYNKNHEPRLFEVAKKKVAYYKTSESKDNPDEFYIISDVDVVFYPHLINNLPFCRSENIKLIISNPCFEVWLYYSQCDDKFDGFIEPLDQTKLSQEVKKWNSTLNNGGGINTKKAIFNLEQNIKNAKKNYTVDSNGIPTKFATNMFVLGEDIYPIIKDGLEYIIKKNQERAALYKKQDT